MSAQSPKKKLAVVLVAANTRKSLAGVLENLAHAGHLEALLFIVCLVDTNCIDPEVTAFFSARLSEDILAVAAYFHLLPVDEDDRDEAWIPPCI